MTEKTNEYKIQTVYDFLNVPEDRLELCLKEFALWLEMVRGYQQVSKELQKIGAEFSMQEYFHWLDDDEGNVHVSMQTVLKTK